MRQLITPLFFVLALFPALLTGQNITNVYTGTSHGINPSFRWSKYACDPERAIKIAVNDHFFRPESDTSLTVSLDSLHYNSGDTLVISITSPACNPVTFINPNVLQDNPTFTLVDFAFEGGNDKPVELKWSTENENKPMRFEVQQFRWNKWLTVGEVMGEGTPGKHDYHLLLPDIVSSKSQYRIAQYGYKDQRLTKPLDCPFTGSEVKLKNVRISNTLEFSRSTLFEIYSATGIRLMTGVAQKVDCSRLPRGSYFLNFDNKTGEFFVSHS